jgi:hypothetical protein
MLFTPSASKQEGTPRSLSSQRKGSKAIAASAENKDIKQQTVAVNPTKELPKLPLLVEATRTRT